MIRRVLPEGFTVRGSLDWSGAEEKESKDIVARRQTYIGTEDKELKNTAGAADATAVVN